MPIPKVLMCSPKYFGVEYVINPWMEGQVGRAKVKKAMSQWNALNAVLSSLTDVELIDPGEHLPDMCFAANGGLVVDNLLVKPRFRVAQRRPEEDLFAEWFSTRGYEIVTLPDNEPFEGEGDALIHHGYPALWAGYGVRSSLDAHRTLAERLQLEVISLRLVDQRFYHLDTCFYPLPGNRIVYYPSAFDELSQREIERRVPAANRFVVSDADALNFTCNAICLGETIITNHASSDLQTKLSHWGFAVRTVPVDEFMLAGGAAKCLTLLLQQDLGPDSSDRPQQHSPLRTTHLSLHGHLLDTGLLNTVIDSVIEEGGSCCVEDFEVGERHDQASSAVVRVTAPTSQRLDSLVGDLMRLGAEPAAEPVDATCMKAPSKGVAPEAFYSTTIYPTDIRTGGQWIRAANQRMDAVVVVDSSTNPPQAECRLMRELQPDDHVVCGYRGVRVHTPSQRQTNDEFSFMSAAVSTERRVELSVETMAWEMRRIRARQGKIVVVAGPVVIHTGGGRYLARLIEEGYVQALLTGNALPVHDIELNMFGTSLGVDLSRGVGIHGGHTHHLRAINRVRAAGSIAEAVHKGVITDGVMFACVQHGVEYVLAGSIRDDGPLPDTMFDLLEAQTAYAKAIDGADMILMLSSMLHAIGTGNMTRSGVRLVCVDINPGVVTKLADRGSLESTGIVTDVGLFLHLLASKLCEE